MAPGFRLSRLAARAIAAVLLATLVLLGATPLRGIALAADIPRLDGAVTDQVGVVGDQKDEVLAALDDVLKRQGVQVFVLFVRSTGDLTATDFVDHTATRNSLGADGARARGWRG